MIGSTLGYNHATFSYNYIVRTSPPGLERSPPSGGQLVDVEPSVMHSEMLNNNA